ncbi:hypothetical protein PILCRDRAFT_11868 [Piloderma croceum F 1598]|uniref:Uncharacterized protein n=1 Tax=Piloderma croceum (strain F 1598) TaxID=765440 RepID=A0A0C3AUM5_PILCF|nr:hypothetical protein PILCRDRAFT_11868 [Piloderma croceum F 1598]
MWKDFNLETAEEADSQEALEFDDEQYPRLPENVLELRLSRRKAFLRQFMAAVRRFYRLTGRIPWGDIAEYPSHHLLKKSRPDCDYMLEDPSNMKADAIDAWLKHWLKLQKKNKRPLVLRDPSDKSSKPAPTRDTIPGRKGKRSKNQHIESDDANDEEIVEEPGNSGSNEPAVLPLSPSSGGLTQNSRRTFLQSLSDDKNDRKLISLLGAAKDSDLLEGTPPQWVTWKSTDNYLPSAFYSKKSPVSLSAFKQWSSMDPITTDGNMLASYDQVELVILGFGLAFRAIWVAQFPERFSDVPTYIMKSSYPFSEYKQLGYNIEELIAGYDETPTEPTTRKAPVNVGEQETDKNDAVGDQNVVRRNDGKVVDDPNNKCSQGLSGVPPSLQHFRQEVGLSGPAWESMGVQWKALTALWLRTEILLTKSGRTDLSFTQVHKSSIPEEWKEWMNAKLMSVDARPPAASFGKVFTNYLMGLPSSTMEKKGMAEFSGAGNNWKMNMKRVEDIFNAISAEHSL